ncbi:magnesium/cobalt transporter CorA [Metabacillus iocasae]|uniref:Magnesium transport protein CorA n=1 Tax=Priestia iocasae TaxID=2291674 RepID=A0ABS2QXZ2_9BACI|nr:magnesium/cobalt transporter CorA [Metabacillus iocasae]MBM7704282.1 magnesium transporter [Metabacillus iocasae]
MITILAKIKDNQIRENVTIEQARREEVEWYWVHFEQPTKEERELLTNQFSFHPLAVEDCFNQGQRAKLEVYDDHYFMVFYALDQKELEKMEVHAFIGEGFLVTYQVDDVQNIQTVWDKVKNQGKKPQDSWGLVYELLDSCVDDYFPPIYEVEDRIDEVEENEAEEPMDELMKDLYEIRSDLSRMRRVLHPMRDLLYRILSLSALKEKEQIRYFTDIYDHLLNMIEIVNGNRELSNDIRESYMSINSDRMNSIMFTLTVMSAIFLPLTFIAGLYGMNFSYMPELTGKYNYFIVLAIMGIMVVGMIFAFYKMGWFKFRKGPKL